jgi:hypothetical protein
MLLTSSGSKTKPSKNSLPPDFSLVSCLAWTTRHCIPEERTLHNHRCQILKSYTSLECYRYTSLVDSSLLIGWLMDSICSFRWVYLCVGMYSCTMYSAVAASLGRTRMMTEVAPETSLIFNKLTRLIAREDFVSVGYPKL